MPAAKRRRYIGAILVGCASLLGCSKSGGPQGGTQAKNWEEYMEDLSSADVTVRAQAAEGLKKGGLPSMELQRLLPELQAAARRETDSAVKATLQEAIKTAQSRTPKQAVQPRRRERGD